MNKLPIRILYIHGGIMNLGGTESYMMNYYRNIDRNKIQIDFVVHGFEKGVYDDEIINLGGNIYNIPVKNKDYFGNIKALKEIFASNKYKIVHSHMDAMGIIPLKLAKKYNIPIRISHSHNTQHLTNNKIKFMLNEYARKNLYKYSTHMLACSEKAGRWMFGDKLFDNGMVKIIYNAIDIDKFKFDKLKRDKIRKELSIGNDFIIGHVGRFDHQKNHLFLLRLFKKVLDKIENAKLILVGDGALKNIIEKEIIDLGIEKQVILLGARYDVNILYNIFDMFILPSFFEGLGIVGIEAQINGLDCLFSTNVPDEIDISNNSYFEDLDSDFLKWRDTIINIYKNYNIETRGNLDYTNKSYENYNINISAKKLEEYYITLYNSVDI